LLAVLLTPRYGDRPVISVEVRAPGPHPVVEQRARLGETLTTLSDDEWASPSRCEGWTTQDVVGHLTSTNQFWAFSIQAGLAGEPTTFLATFDPVASPAQLAEQQRGTASAQTLEAFLTSSAALADVIAGLDDDAWEVLAEAPPGHLPIRLVADHALWDGWVHERDILVPLGRVTVVSEPEVLVALRYSAALGPAFAACAGSEPPAPVELRTTDPDSRLVVETDGDVARVHDGPAPPGAACVDLDTVALVELLSCRDPGVPEPAPLAVLTAGVASVFDQVS
jgi:uncharacterized protein (TIGR03083 family)